MTTEQLRAKFEAHFSKPPYEFDLTRHGNRGAWPNQYVSYATECAWEAWQAADAQEELQDAFTEFAAEYPKSALALITGLFVGLLESSIDDAGGDPKLEIKIDGCGKRDITVSAVPNV